jgi:ribose 5-phosphate isomerase A
MSLLERALEFVKEGSIVGLGTGRAASLFIEALALRVRKGFSAWGVPTSRESERLARSGGIPLRELSEDLVLDLTVDGADEVDPQLDLIKGYGGALVREKIVAAASRYRVILVGAEKLVPRLGSHGRLPVEIVPFASGPVRRSLRALGYPASIRSGDGGAFVTDNGNVILDLSVSPLEDPGRLEHELREIPGVVGTGLFVGLADVVLVDHPGGSVEVLKRKSR